jgi:hypothetical protein
MIFNCWIDERSSTYYQGRESVISYFLWGKRLRLKISNDLKDENK